MFLTILHTTFFCSISNRVFKNNGFKVYAVDLYSQMQMYVRKLWN